MTVELTTFGFKAGAPDGADLTLDVRELPNPFYDPSLKALTGCDAAITAFFASQPGIAEAIDTYYARARAAVDAAAERGASHARVAIGCTGGQHRSVYVAERVAERLRCDAIDVRIVHRELSSR